VSFFLEKNHEKVYRFLRAPDRRQLALHESMTGMRSALFLFAYDLFHQVLFYFGTVAAMVIFLLEKISKKPVPWRWILPLFLFLLFVSSFHAWIDEHRNSEALIQEKARLTSDNQTLQRKLDAKQIEADWLRDHQQVHVEGGSALDPRVATILDRLNRENQALRTEPGKSYKKGLVDLAKEMLDFFQKERIPYDQASADMTISQSLTDPKARQDSWA
jgi:hypothetical protein